MLAGFLLGVGAVATVDEVVFHQLLHSLAPLLRPVHHRDRSGLRRAVLRVQLVRRGSDWPLSRTLWSIGGWTCVAMALAGPLAQRAHHDFAAAHVLAGMAAPLLLVSAAPVTLLLRVLPTPQARPWRKRWPRRPRPCWPIH